MLRFLKAKMFEGQITDKDIARLINCSDRSVRSKLSEETAFSLPDALKIRDSFFPGIPTEILFASDKQKTA